MIFAFVYFALLVLCSGVRGTNLYPSCRGNELVGSAAAGNEVTIHTIPQELENLTITCFAYELSSLTGGMKAGARDPCSVEHQTEYLHRVVIRAKRNDQSTGQLVTTDYDVKDLSGGSLGRIAIRFTEKHSFSLVLINQGLNQLCSLHIRAIMDYVGEAEVTENKNLPVVVSVEPRTVYTKQNSKTKLFLRYPKGTDMQKVQNDVVTLTDLDKKCSLGNTSGNRMRSLAPSADLSRFDNDSTLGVRDYFFDIPDTYRICYYGSLDTKGSELALIRIFDGNPSYYQIVGGQDSDGRIFVGVETTIKFYGHALDTRVDGDRAKLTYETEDCATGSPAGGVPEATDLGPQDDYGPYTTYSLWRWALKESGVFKICYKRRYGSWTEVPSITDISPRVGPVIEPDDPNKEKKIPQPVDPVTKKECPMAPPSTKEAPWVAYKSIKLTFNATRVSPKILNMLSRAICVPRAALVPTHITHDRQGHQVLYLSILCEDLAEAASCDTVERQNYLVYLGKTNSSLLSELKILSVNGSRHMFAFGDDPVFVEANKNYLIVFLISCTTVVLVAAISVYGLLKYREHREYFIQFGTDDEDADDMYTTPTTTRSPFKTGNTGRAAIDNAVIEVEE